LGQLSLPTATAPPCTHLRPHNPAPRPTLQAQRLHDNWYATTADISSMSRDEVTAVGMPFRLWATVKLLLEAHEGGSQAAAAASAAGAAEADLDAAISQGGTSRAVHSTSAGAASSSDSAASTSSNAGSDSCSAEPVPAVVEQQASAGIAQALVATQPLNPDIMQRRAPARARLFPRQVTGVTKRIKGEPYAVKVCLTV
jgi:hypothetical protein